MAAPMVGAALPRTWIAHPAPQIAWAGLVVLAQLAAVDWIVQRGAKRLRALNDLARELSHPHDVSTMVDIGLHAAVRLMGSERERCASWTTRVARARRSGLPMSLAAVEVDRFKQINDEHGHVTGDRVLAAVASALQAVRGGDVAARYGGDEFVVLMPETRRDDADRAAARIRERVNLMNQARLFPFPISVSIGVRQLGEPGADLMADADEAMYVDKQSRPVAGRPHAWSDRSRRIA